MSLESSHFDSKTNGTDESDNLVLQGDKHESMAKNSASINPEDGSLKTNHQNLKTFDEDVDIPKDKDHLHLKHEEL